MFYVLFPGFIQICLFLQWLKIILGLKYAVQLQYLCFIFDQCLKKSFLCSLTICKFLVFRAKKTEILYPLIYMFILVNS